MQKYPLRVVSLYQEKKNYPSNAQAHKLKEWFAIFWSKSRFQTIILLKSHKGIKWSKHRYFIGETLAMQNAVKMYYCNCMRLYSGVIVFPTSLLLYLSLRLFQSVWSITFTHTFFLKTTHNVHQINWYETLTFIRSSLKGITSSKILRFNFFCLKWCINMLRRVLWNIRAVRRV